MSTAPTAQDLAQQAIQYQKLTTEILGHEQVETAKLRKQSKVRWDLFILGLLFFVLSKYVVLRTQFKQVFDMFKEGYPTNAGLSCASSSSAQPWNIVLNVAYPWIGKIFYEEPLGQQSAEFLWMAIRSNAIPTDADIASCAACNGLGLTPLAYLCGNILAAWNTATGVDHTIADVQANPENTPWSMFLNSNSCILLHPNDLTTLVTSGFWGIALNMLGSTPQQLYNEIFDQGPPNSGCSTSGAVTSVVSGMGSFAMAGMAFGPEFMAPAAILGGTFGFFSGSSGCGGSSCSIM